MFKTELELVAHIQTILNSGSDKRLLRGKMSALFTELGLGYGIADVVAVASNPKKEVRNDFLEYFDISVLNLIEKNGKVSFEDIVFITRSPQRKIQDALATLMDQSFVVFRKGYYTSHKKYADTLTDSIAIEAKLKDWKRALKQAYRYKWFSNKAFVFIPEEHIAIPTKNLDEFKKHNVGLASVSKEKGIVILFSPKKEKPICQKMSRALNEYYIQQKIHHL